MASESLNPRSILEMLCVDCRDPDGLSNWWQQLLGGERRVDADGDVHLEGGPLPLLFTKVPEPKSVKNRLHLDLRAIDYDETVAHVLALGASSGDDIYITERWRIFRDPEGNEFCILRPVPAAHLT